MRVLWCTRNLRISHPNAHRIFKDDLKLQSYRKNSSQKAKRLKFVNWIQTSFRKEETLKFLFSEEKLFDIDEVYNSQNDRIRAPNHTEAMQKMASRKCRNSLKTLWYGLEHAPKNYPPLIIFEEATVYHDRYIQKVLPVTLKFRNDMFGNSWMFQQGGGKPHIHERTQDWCRTHLPCLIDKDHWPPNSPDFNPLDYYIWDEFEGGAINRDLVTSKVTLINQLKLSLKKIRSVVFGSFISWTNRSYRMKQVHGGDYLHK